MIRYGIIFLFLIALPVCGAVDDSYTRVLHHFDGASGSAVIVDEHSDNAWTASGGALLDTGKQRFGVSSLYFDGSGSYLRNLASDSRFSNASGTWTFEAWVYPTAYKPIRTTLFSYLNGSSFLQAFFNSSGVLWISTNAEAPSGQLMGSTGVSTGQWSHVALVGQVGTVTAYINGVPIASHTLTLPNVASGTFDMGWDAAQVSGREFTGWMDEIRFSNGIARYTEAFTPPTKAFSPPMPNLAFAPGGKINFNISAPLPFRSLMHFNASTTLDAYAREWIDPPFIANDPEISTDVYKFGGGALSLLTAASAVISSDDAPTASGTEPFTFDTWFRIATYSAIAGQRFYPTWDTGGFAVRIDTPLAGGDISILDGAVVIASYTFPAFPGDEWHHLAVTYDGSDADLYYDGDLIASGAYAAFGNSGQVNAGYMVNISGSANMQRYLDEWRFSDSILYSGNFTPPISETASETFVGRIKFYP